MFGFMHWMPFGLFGGIGLLGCIAVIVLIVVLVSRSGGHHHQWRDNRHSSAEEILKERLARGEIDEETYEKLLSKIRSQS